jgi:ABC-type cobalamin/Fe3+-siderophores transport system ATPase subunit
MSTLECRSVALRYGARDAVRDVSCELRAGELLGIIGPNGAGKSSLLRAMAGLARPTAGSVLLDGRDLAAWRPGDRARLLAYLPQSAPLHWPLSVRAVVELGRLPFQAGWFVADAGADEAVDAALREAEVTHLQDRLVTELSGGERARVMIARLLAAAPRVMLADEPVAALDAYHQLHVMEVLARHVAQGAAAAVVLHDLGLAARFCQHILVLQEGCVARIGSAAEVLVPEVLEPVYGVRMRAFDADGVTVMVALRRSDT